MPTQQEYLEAEKQLAELLGWRDIEYFEGSLTGSNKGRPRTVLPRWARSTFSAYVLADKLGIDFIGMAPYEIVHAAIAELKVAK